MSTARVAALPTVNPYSTGLDAGGYTLAELFPEVDPQFRPFGSRVLVQLRRVVHTTKSGIILAQETKDTEAWNIQVAKLIRLGPLAFRRRDTAEPWPEGVWAQPGDFVKVPRWGGDRWSLDQPSGEPVAVVLFNDADLLGKYEGDPLRIRAYLA